MKKNVSLSIKSISYYIMVSFFFMGNLKFFKMILAYLGIENGITAIAVGMFAMVVAVVIFYCINHAIRQKDWKGFLLLGALCIIYGLPYVVHGLLYKLVQYCLFVAPLAITAYLVASDEKGCETFFSYLSKISRVAVFPFLLYIIVLFITPPGESGIVMIKEMSYGDIALAALPFFFADLALFCSEQTKPNVATGMRILVYLASLIYSGSRSTIFCMILAFALQLLVHFKQILEMPLLKKSLSALCFLLVVVFCMTVTPTGARLNVIKDNIVHELGNEGLNQIFEEYPSGDDLSEDESSVQRSPSQVFCVKTRKYMSIHKAFEYYIVNSDSSITETQEFLHNDIVKGEKKYLIVSPEYQEFAELYEFPINSRVYLWSTAWNEFKNSPLIGNGILYYQQKYDGTFPHNIIFELMCDFGIVGTVLFFGAALYLLVSCVIIAVKIKSYGMGQMLVFIISYIPMHLLYHSLYFNGILFFTFVILLFLRIKNKSVPLLKKA